MIKLELSYNEASLVYSALNSYTYDLKKYIEKQESLWVKEKGEKDLRSYRDLKNILLAEMYSK